MRRGGEVLIYGVYPKAATFPVNPFDVFRNEITIKGSVAQIHDFGRALENAWQRRGIKSVLLPPGS